MLKNKSTTQNLSQIISVAIFLIIWTSTLQGQSRINSPYSMFGPGEVKGNEYFRNMSLGGISQGFRSNVSVNYLNPASYTATDSLSFVFDGTVFSHIYQQKISDLEQTTGYTAMANLNFAFPVTRRWSVAAGLLPWSQMGYKISDFREDEVTGRINYFYEGNGGISQVYMGHGFQLYKGLSAGVNLSYLFGKVEDRLLAQSDSAGFHRTGWSYSDQVNGFMFSSGLQWQFPLGETRSLTLGATYTGPANLDIEQSSFITRNLPGATSIDTLNFREGQSGTMEIPASMAAGVFMNINPRWSGGLDFQSQNWSSYKTFDSIHNLNDAYMLRAGAILNPRIETYTGFFNRLEYRFGARYGKSFLSLQDRNGINQDFSEFGISFGVGVPVRRSLSALNFGFEYSRRNSGSSDLIEENYFRFNIGINVYERWFVKRKFY